MSVSSTGGHLHEGPPDTKLDRHVLMIAGVVVLGAIMSILDVTVVAVAQNTFQQEFGTDAAGAAWTATGYTLALAAVIPLSSWAAARFGTKKVYLTSLVLFVLGSALCALAWNIGSLVAFRVIQGLGGGLLMPIGMMILTKAAGPERIGSVMAVLGIPMLLGPIGGPILGGFLIETTSWHWVFLINVPIGIVALVYSWFVLRDDEETTKASIDIVGLLLLSPGLALFLFGISSSAEHRTFLTPTVLIPAIIGAILIVAFIWHALRAKNPLLDLRLFRNRTLSISVVTMTLFMIAFFGASLLFPQYFIGVRGESTLTAGLLLAPQGLGAMLTMPIAGKLTDKMGPGKFVLPGIVLILLGMGVFIFLGADTSYWILCSALFVQGLGMGMTMMPIMSAALATLNNKQVPDGSTLVNVVQQTASSIGTAVISVVLASGLAGSMQAGLAIASNTAPDKLPPEMQNAPLPQSFFESAAEIFGSTFLVAVILIALTFIPAFFLPRKKIQSPLVEEDMDRAPIIMH
ncbi:MULTISPECIES: DHA2 family efflux MFS transporter permease subunit [unclassified Gordonia (in: high G+C Gram-positive bacteria)]|uniref:DHA2 family efflux MFS transporter permease subunit n=1 Tax=unclassified Gordonia (in: high G+C Gram-positive bacteria) TaxID=2657482 RepID=UPI001F0FF1C0|nr:DHA2 family efflux MFS transporter permease subunit [Gordonia sp. ABSL49_1]MCH5645427.1 DHA2 family efflux MFS transporter permease subunit [Gordonia sp. ABSL49_1]